MMKKFWFASAVLLVLIVATSCEQANPIAGPIQLTAVQVGDSMYIAARWGAADPPGSGQAAQEGYDVVLVEVGADTLFYHEIGMQTVDTFWMGLPAVLDTLSVYAGVSTRDVAGNLSEWKLSNRLDVIGAIGQPNPPGPISIDTAANNQVVGVILRPDHSNARTIDTLHFCAYTLMQSGEVWPTTNTVGSPYCGAALPSVQAQADIDVRALLLQNLPSLIIRQ